MRSILLLSAAVAGVLGLPVCVHAQDAAETAIILGGTGNAQGRAQRSLGSAIARGMGNAAGAVAATTPARTPHGSTTQRSRSHGRTQGNFAIPLPGDVDPLAKTDAPSFKVGSGATLRVSGGLRRKSAVVEKAPEDAGR